MRGPLVTRRVMVPVVAAVLMLLVGWTLAAPVTSASSRVPRQDDETQTTVEAPPETTTTATPETSTPPVPTVANESTQTVETKGEIDDPAQKQLRWIIGGLIGLAVAILLLTIWYWRATRPAKRVHGDGVSAGVTTMDEALAVDRPTTSGAAVPVGAAAGAGPAAATDSVRIATRTPSVPPGHRAPIWADEHLSAGTARPSAKGPAKGPETDR